MTDSSELMDRLDLTQNDAPDKAKMGIDPVMGDCLTNQLVPLLDVSMVVRPSKGGNTNLR